jgi:hypothetical protein
LDEPVHARVRREKGMLLSSSSGRAAPAAELEEDGMEESSGDSEG